MLSCHLVQRWASVLGEAVVDPLPSLENAGLAPFFPALDEEQFEVVVVQVFLAWDSIGDFLVDNLLELRGMRGCDKFYFATFIFPQVFMFVLQVMKSRSFCTMLEWFARGRYA